MLRKAKKKNKKFKILSLLAITAFLIFPYFTSYAAGEKILSTIVYDDSIYIFVRGVSQIQSDSVIQIGNVICPNEQIATTPLSSSGLPMRTLILVDNSKSISENSHADIKTILDGTIDAAMESEQIRIATISDQVNYLCDYTNDKEALKNAIASIEYNDQDTYLSDILYDAISAIREEDICAYTRIIIVADGADDKPNGYTSDEVRSFISENSYPVYTIGVPGSGNSSNLEVMFSFSRASGSEYFLLDGSVSNEEIIAALSQDQNSMCINIKPDESLKDGSNKNILLKLSMAEGSIELKTSTDMPFGNGIAEEEKEEIEEEEESTENESENELPEIKPVSSSDNDKATKTIPWIPIVIITVVIILAAAGVIVFVIIRRKKKKVNTPVEEDIVPPDMQVTGRLDDDATGVLIEDEPINRDEESATEPLWGGYNIFLILTRIDSPDIKYKKTIKDVLHIGRMNDQDIIINDDKLSKHHCEIRLRGDLLYIKDCNSKNGTKYEGMAVYDSECPIISGGKIKIGSYSYRVDLVKE